MSYNGAGVFQINSAGQPVVTGTTISSTAFNALTADLATGLSTAVLKDGTQTATASIPLQQGFSVGAGAAFAMNSSGTVITLLDISNAAAGQIKFPATQNPSANANTLDDYAEGSYTSTLTGVTGTVTPTTRYTKIGNQVTLSFDSSTGTSNTTAKTYTGMPAALRPAGTRIFPVLVNDNGGAITQSYAQIAASGVITFVPSVGGTNWTGSGTMIIQNFQATYTLA